MKMTKLRFFCKTSACPMNIHKMRSALQRKRRQNFFQSCLELQDISEGTSACMEAKSDEINTAGVLEKL